MRRIFQLAAFTMVLVLTASLRNGVSAQDDEYYEDEYYDDRRGDVSYQTFYDELSPYGRWIDYPEYGYVWVPNAGPSFRPYSTNGRWVYTSGYEWMWVSDYSWGWAPFHYGRWLYDPFYGWIWVPGYEWAPAWVVWRSGGDYFGWAPLRPGIHISINFSIGSYSPPYDYWCFAPRRYITSPRIYDYCYDRRQNVTIINQTTIINNYNYSRNVFRTGPSRFEAERYAGRITPVRFRESSRPGRTQFRNNEVSVYRPRVQRDDTRRFAPRSVERYERQGGNGSDRVARNDNRNGGNGGRFERGPVTRGNGNNLPRRERTESAPVERGNRDIREPRQPRQFEQRGGGFERNNEAPVRQPRREMSQGNGNRSPQMERRAPQPQQPRREMSQGNGNRSPQMERRAPQPQQPRREMSQGNGNRSPQMERREPQPQQPRQFERRESGERPQQGNSGGNNGNGRGRGRN